MSREYFINTKAKKTEKSKHYSFFYSETALQNQPGPRDHSDDLEKGYHFTI